MDGMSMKILNTIFLLVAIVLAFTGLYFWFLRDQIDYAALCIALAVGMHAVYLHSTKADKKS
jgi:uncharacterized iron-regulated membrane protein